jgi:hypothetical protein
MDLQIFTLKAAVEFAAKDNKEQSLLERGSVTRSSSAWNRAFEKSHSSFVAAVLRLTEPRSYRCGLAALPSFAAPI